MENTTQLPIISVFSRRLTARMDFVPAVRRDGGRRRTSHA